MLSEEAADLYQCLAGRKVFVTPTLVLYPAVARARSKAAVPAGTMAFIDGTRRIARRLHDAGVPLLSGTDTSDTGDLDLHPGSALLDELESLQEAGIPPREILKIATGNAAAALGLEGTVGTIEVGKQADFVLLAQDPGADVRALRSPVAVYRRGSQVAFPVP
jgi:imidazolonepropionase-like amidohydrolase